MRNVLVVLSGPSGVGKGTVAKRLVEKNKDLALSISYTTRAPRKGEEDGKDYFFTTREDFDNKISQNGFLEYSNHFDNFYGTPKQFVKDKLEFGDVLLEIDVNGGLQVKNNFPDAVLIMLLPPNKEELVRRLVERNTETEDKIKARLLRLDYEMEMERLYDYSVVNDDLETAVTEIESIIEKEKNR